MKVLIIDNGTKHLDELLDWLAPHQTAVIGFGEASVEGCAQYDLIVLSGGSLHSVVGNEDKYAAELRVIRESGKPILGICLGFELIANAFGGTLVKLEDKRRGDIEIELVQGDALIGGFLSLRVHEAHRWVVSDPGPVLIPLGRSEDGFEIVRHETLPIVGFQFHPEFTGDPAIEVLFTRFLASIRKN